MDDNELMVLSLGVQEMRGLYGWGQDDLAVASSMHPSAISHLETMRRPPTFLTVARIAHAGQMSIAHLMALGEQALARQYPQKEEVAYEPA